ncbi:MAG: hypothetical protein C5B52_07085, partial [Bacteroidetes bacterium]
YNKNQKLEWIGRSGGGFKEKEMPQILKTLKAIETENSPFVNKVLDTKGATIHYVKPKLVGNFEFATWTKSGRIRKPAIFLGFRNDKRAQQVIREIPKSVDIIEEDVNREGGHHATKPAKKLKTQKKSNWSILEKIRHRSESQFEMDGCTVPLTDVEKELWKGVTKADVISYYHRIAPILLPHLHDRPLSLHVKYKGPFAEGVYIKDMEGRQPTCATVFTDKRRHPKEGKNSNIDYLVCNNEATLLYTINLGCIDVNPWMSRIETPDYPDFINIDLDPSDQNFEKVMEVALAAREVLEKLHLKSFIKTSGKTGLHLYLPVTNIAHPQARAFSEQLGKMILELVPAIATTETSINSRGKKVYIDPSQNDYADTLASAYSLRPNSLPTVSTPLEWKELKKNLNPHSFTMEMVMKRIEIKGDLFQKTLSPLVARHNTAKLQKL